MPSKNRNKSFSPPLSTSRPEQGSSSIARLVVIAATLLSVPGSLFYLTGLLLLFLLKTDLSGNVMAPLLLASIGLGLWMLALFGLIAGLWVLLIRNTPDRVVSCCLWLNAIILAGMMAVAVFSPQLG